MRDISARLKVNMGHGWALRYLWDPVTVGAGRWNGKKETESTAGDSGMMDLGAGFGISTLAG